MNKKKNIIVFIHEGEDDEKRILENIKSKFFPKRDEKEIVFLPFKTDIYTLWQEVNEDEFLNVVTVLKNRDENNRKVIESIDIDNISQTFLFFDCDGHARYPKGDGNEIIGKMLETFDDETELGKLYISYPMVETYKDLNLHNECSRNCHVSAIANEGFRELFAKESAFDDLKKFNSETWFYVSYHNICKANCICCDNYDFPDFKVYTKHFNQENIFRMQLQKFIVTDEVATLSSFPFFLTDYFGEKFYNKFPSFGVDYCATKAKHCAYEKLVSK